jgi:hypothetical protein
MILTKKRFEKILKTNNQSRKNSKKKQKKIRSKSSRNKQCNNYTLKQKGGILGFDNKNNDDKLKDYKSGIELIKTDSVKWNDFFGKLYENIKIFDDEGITTPIETNLELNISIFLEFLKNQKSQIESYINSNYLNTAGDQINSNIPYIIKNMDTKIEKFKDDERLIFAYDKMEKVFFNTVGNENTVIKHDPPPGTEEEEKEEVPFDDEEERKRRMKFISGNSVLMSIIDAREDLKIENNNEKVKLKDSIENVKNKVSKMDDDVNKLIKYLSNNSKFLNYTSSDVQDGSSEEGEINLDNVKKDSLLAIKTTYQSLKIFIKKIQGLSEILIGNGTMTGGDEPAKASITKFFNENDKFLKNTKDTLNLTSKNISMCSDSALKIKVCKNSELQNMKELLQEAELIYQNLYNEFDKFLQSTGKSRESPGAVEMKEMSPMSKEEKNKISSDAREYVSSMPRGMSSSDDKAIKAAAKLQKQRSATTGKVKKTSGSTQLQAEDAAKQLTSSTTGKVKKTAASAQLQAEDAAKQLTSSTTGKVKKTAASAQLQAEDAAKQLNPSATTRIDKLAKNKNKQLQREKDKATQEITSSGEQAFELLTKSKNKGDATKNNDMLGGGLNDNKEEFEAYKKEFKKIKDGLKIKLNTLEKFNKDFAIQSDELNKDENFKKDKEDLGTELKSELVKVIKSNSMTLDLINRDCQNILKTMEELQQEYLDIISLAIDLKKKVKSFEESSEKMNATLDVGVAETVKYDEIKILVETGSYTVEQSRHLNSMESLFTKADEDEIDVRKNQAAKERVTEELLKQVEEELEPEKEKIKQEQLSQAKKTYEQVDEQSKAILEKLQEVQSELSSTSSMDPTTPTIVSPPSSTGSNRSAAFNRSRLGSRNKQLDDDESLSDMEL